MSLSRKVLLFLALLLVAGESAAGDGLAREDGVRLLQTCRAANDVVSGRQVEANARVDAALCAGFVEGFIWGQGWKSWRSGEDMYFCPPQGLRYEDVLPPLLSYLEAHPERLIQRAHLLLFSALSSIYPCTP
jgi:hypothetical protein